jgi:hypothetical protein
MESYTLVDILWPWAALLTLLWLIGKAEDWIHKHFYGMGWLLTQNEISATRLFYVFFAPGVFLHELVQYLVAGALNIPIKKGFHWPQQQSDGSMRLNFVVMQRDQTTLWRAMCFAGAPFLVMGLVVWHISIARLDLHDFTAALGTADLDLMGAGFLVLVEKPDFVVWFYLLFTIANTMVPNKADAEGLPLVGLAFVAIFGVMLFYGIEGALINFLGGPVAQTLGLINTALVGILVLDWLGIAGLWLVEDRISAWRGLRMDYGTQLTAEAKKATTRQPGSATPLPVGTLLPSIYNFELPLPDPNLAPAPEKAAAPARPQPALASTRSPQPSFSAEAPARSASARSPQPSVAPSEPAARPAFAQAESSARPPLNPGDRPSNFSIRPRPSEDSDPAEEERTSALFNRRPSEVEARREGPPSTERPAAPMGSRPSNPGSSPFNRSFTPAPKPSSNRSLDALRPASDSDEEAD